jgi:hypothetical protein
LISRTGRYKWFGVAGLTAATAGAFLLSRIDVATTNAVVASSMVLIGAGLGVTMPLFTISLQAQFQHRMGEVTGALQFFRSIGGTVGVALLGGVRNASFARELTRLVERDAGKFGQAGGFLERLAGDPSRLLNADALRSVASQLPPGAQPVLQQFFADVRLARAEGISTAFLYAFVLMALAVVGMLLVREVPLHAAPRLQTAAEIGTELLAEEAVQPAEHEPVVIDAEAEPEPAG